MAFTEAVLDFLQTDEFADTAVWSVGSKSVRVIYDTGYQAAELGAMAGIEGARITAMVATADVPTVAHGQTLTIQGVAYIIREVQTAPGDDWTLCVLQAP